MYNWSTLRKQERSWNHVIWVKRSSCKLACSGLPECGANAEKNHEKTSSRPFFCVHLLCYLPVPTTVSESLEQAMCKPIMSQNWLADIFENLRLFSGNVQTSSGLVRSYSEIFRSPALQDKNLTHLPWQGEIPGTDVPPVKARTYLCCLTGSVYYAVSAGFHVTVR